MTFSEVELKYIENVVGKMCNAGPQVIFAISYERSMLSKDTM